MDTGHLDNTNSVISVRWKIRSSTHTPHPLKKPLSKTLFLVVFRKKGATFRGVFCTFLYFEQMEEQEGNLVKVIDGICGAGKSYWSLLNAGGFVDLARVIEEQSIDSDFDYKVIFITPFRSECHRLAGTTPVDQGAEDFRSVQTYGGIARNDPNNLRLHHPIDENEYSISTGFKQLLREGKSIVTTHSSFYLWDNETFDLIASQAYHLYIDETPSMIETLKDYFDRPENEKGKSDQTISTDEIEFMCEKQILSIEENGKVNWNTAVPLKSLARYKNIYDLCKQQVLYYFQDGSKKVLIRRQNPRSLTSFQSVHLLTYLFNGSLFKKYLELENISYSYEDFTATQLQSTDRISPYHQLISSKRYNNNTVRNFSLSWSWYTNNQRTEEDFQLLSLVMNNFFKKSRSSADEKLWTCIKAKKEKITGSHIPPSAFLQSRSRATNDYNNCSTLAYATSIFLNPMLKKYFASKSLTAIDEKIYATGEMLQWIFRSRIRKGEEIQILVVSERMRNFLSEWMRDFERKYNAALLIRNQN